MKYDNRDIILYTSLWFVGNLTSDTYNRITHVYLLESYFVDSIINAIEIEWYTT